MEATEAQFGRLLETTPEPMTRFLQWIEAEAGDIPSFLQRMGVTPETLATVRGYLLEP